MLKIEFAFSEDRWWPCISKLWYKYRNYYTCIEIMILVSKLWYMHRNDDTCIVIIQKIATLSVYHREYMRVA